jgi:F1F0 ATPase subunit 2
MDSELLTAAMPLLAAFVAGLGLGFIYFGGLWLTVRQLASTNRPGLLFAASFTIRTALVVAGIFFAGGGQWQRIAACMIGFIIMRMVLTRRWGPDQTSRTGGSPA